MVKSNELTRAIDILDIKDFEELDENSTLGKGGFGIVYKTKSKNGDKNEDPVVIKYFWDEISEKNFTKIVDLYGRLDQFNLVFLKGVIDTNISPFALVSEYLPKGNLLRFVRESQDLFSKKRVGEICDGICSGMEYLHGHGIVHECLCAENVLLDNDYKAKISDYCLSHFVRPHENHFGNNYNKLKGPYGVRVRWQPMECIVLEDGTSPDFSYASDVWSFGVIIFEIWSKGKLPYAEAKTNEEAAELILKGKNPFDFFKPQMNKDLYKMCDLAFSKNPEDRPLFSALRKWVEIGHAPDPRLPGSRRKSRKSDERRLEIRSDSSRSSSSRLTAERTKKEPQELELVKEISKRNRDRIRKDPLPIKEPERWRELETTNKSKAHQPNNVAVKSLSSLMDEPLGPIERSNGDHCCSCSRDSERRMKALEERVNALEIALENKSNAAKE